MFQNKNILGIYTKEKDIIYIPISVNLGVFQGFYVILLISAFFNYLYLGVFKGNNLILDPKHKRLTNLHFIPLILASFITVLNHVSKYNLVFQDIKGEFIADIFFNIIALIFVFFIDVQTVHTHDWFIIMTIKKGLYSALLALLLYNF